MEEHQEPTLLQSLRGHRGEVTCVDVCGASLVSGGGRELRLWRWRRGEGWRQRAEAGADRHRVTAVRWAAGGALLASAGVDGAARLWAGRALAPRALLAAPGAAPARALCWAGRARLLAGHDDGALHVWLAPRALLLARLRTHDAALHAVAAPARGLLLLTACANGVLKVFDLAEVCRSGTEESMAPPPLTWVDGAHDLGALCADATDDGRMVATGGHDALVRVWHAHAGGVRAGAALEGHAAAVTALRWGAGGALASAALDGTARLWAPRGASLLCQRVVHAHPRYLTCVALSHDMRYMVTGSNDKSVRMWSLSSLTWDDELEPPCDVRIHFALGDLEGIAPLDESADIDENNVTQSATVELEPEVAGGSGSHCVWESMAHAGAINCVAVHDDLVATASSDGSVRLFRWSADSGEMDPVHELDAHQYPAMAVDFGAGGAILLTAGLDGRACVWDVETGVQLRSLSVPAGCGAGLGGDAGGGGMRGARVSAHRPPLLLLGTDDGLVPLWSLATNDPHPVHVYAGHTDAVTACAWAPDGRLAAAGASDGALRLYRAEPPAALHHEPRAHDLGVQSCDFAPSSSELALSENTYLLATAGCDSLIKLWIIVFLEEEDPQRMCAVRPALSLAAHGGGAACVRWAGALLASAGADGCVRVWRAAAGGATLNPLVALPAPGVGPTPRPLAALPAPGGGPTPRALAPGTGPMPHALEPLPAPGGCLTPRPLAALPAPGGGPTLRPLAALPAQGALCASVLPAHRVLVAGSVTGRLIVWRLPASTDDQGNHDTDEECTAPSFWSHEGVVHWLQEYVTRAPGSRISHDQEGDMVTRILQTNITGSRLYSDTIEDLLFDLGYGEEQVGETSEDDKIVEERKEVRRRLRVEIEWLRHLPASLALEREAPHWLLCPLSHRLMREPACAADGYTYERATILDWFIAAEGAVSPLSGRRLHNARVLPNHAVRAQLRLFLLQHAK